MNGSSREARVAPRRPFARAFGLFAGVLLLVGQTALIAHHHEPGPRSNGRPSVSRRSPAGDAADCRLCSVSSESFAAHAPAPRPAAAAMAASSLADVPAFAVICRAPLDSSCRAPPIG